MVDCPVMVILQRDALTPTGRRRKLAGYTSLGERRWQIEIERGAQSSKGDGHAGIEVGPRREVDQTESFV